MAQVTSGSVRSNTMWYSTFYVDWERTSYDVSKNTSTIKWKAGLETSNNVYWLSNAVTINSIYIDGTLVLSGKTYSNISGNGKHELASGTITINHNNDGKKSFSISISGWLYDTGSPSGSSTFELVEIPRYLAIVSLSVENITETSCVVRWITSHPRSSTYYSLDDGATWIGSATDGETLASDTMSGSFNILNLSANTAYRIKFKFKRTDNGVWKESTTLYFSTYNYPHCTSTPNFTIGNALTLDFYNPLGRSFTVKGYSKTDGREIFSGSSNGTRLVGFNDSNSVTEQYKSIPNSQSGQYKVVVTYNNISLTRDAGNTYQVRGNEIPTVGNLSYADISGAISVTGNPSHIVQNYSELLVSFTNATPNYYAGSIAKYIVTANWTEQHTKAGQINFGRVDSESDIDLILVVVDSRGLKATKTMKVTVLPHSEPTASVTLHRLNNYEDETYLTVDGSIASVNDKNKMTIKYRYKVSGGSYGDYVTIGDRVKQTLSLDKNNSYIFEVVVTDSFNYSFVKEYALGKGVFPLFIDTGKNSVGVNKLPVYENSLEVSGLFSLGEANVFELEAGESKTVHIFLNGVTGLVNFRVAGANLEIARLFYIFRPTQYFGIHKTLVDESYNSTGDTVPFSLSNSTNGYSFRITNNFSSNIFVRYGILELC